jgi:hypothetical protein
MESEQALTSITLIGRSVKLGQRWNAGKYGSGGEFWQFPAWPERDSIVIIPDVAAIMRVNSKHVEIKPAESA